MNIGNYWEKLVSHFFDSKISKFYTFKARSKDKAEIADAVVWHNRELFLIEVKSRDPQKATAPIESWATGKIEEAVTQVRRNFDRCIARETIYLHNEYFHVELDYEGLTYYTGLVILCFDGACNLCPTDSIPDIYTGPLRFHVLTWNDLCSLSSEVDTVPDLFYYLQDRYQYVRKHDIPLGVEKEVIGCYKLHENTFPSDEINFAASSLWTEYQETMAAAINRRDTHNDYSLIVDELEACLADARKLFSGLPIGLYYVWEIGSQTRRQRAYLGKTRHRVRQDFEKGRRSRQFCIFNQSSHNWHVYYFFNDVGKSIGSRLRRIVRLKLIKEVHISKFEYGVYGFAFRVSSTIPLRLLGLAEATVMGACEANGYSDTDLDEALRVWGSQKYTSMVQIREFPESGLKP